MIVYDAVFVQYTYRNLLRMSKSTSSLYTHFYVKKNTKKAQKITGCEQYMLKVLAMISSKLALKSVTFNIKKIYHLASLPSKIPHIC